ncbi:hypothetical protein [uncultured Roseobacter sp.]|uniref:hypothetical protein n=1 Tax=uncultured Roseobacter sp. TaxID=114847 RepID=UPI00261D8D29|nr:hypothetical protein [uncultured Roseobacter sp.]
MEWCIDEAARRFGRANMGIRALRVHLYLVFMGLIGQFVGASALWLYEALANDVTALTRLGALTGRQYGGVNWTLVVALGAAAVLMGQGVDAVVKTASRLGMVRILFGLFLVVWFIFAPFFFSPSSFGLIGDSDYWPLRFLAVFLGGLTIYLVGLAYAVYGVLGLRDAQVRSWLEASGLGRSRVKTLALLCVGPLNGGNTSWRWLSGILVVSAAFLLGWGTFVLYGIPLGAMATISVSENRVVLGGSILELQAASAIAKAFLAFALITIGRLVLRQARLAATPSVAQSIKNPLAALYLRPFRFDRTEFNALKRGMGPRFFDLDTGAHAIEEIIVGRFASQGSVLAIGAPNLPERQDGTLRMHLNPDGDWKTSVEDLMPTAGVIVIVLGDSPGVVWELETIDRLELWHKSIVLFPVEDMQRQWRTDALERILDLLAIDPKELSSDPARRIVAAAGLAEDTTTLYSTTRVSRGAYQAALATALEIHTEPNKSRPKTHKYLSASRGTRAVTKTDFTCG